MGGDISGIPSRRVRVDVGGDMAPCRHAIVSVLVVSLFIEITAIKSPECLLVRSFLRVNNLSGVVDTVWTLLFE
jgi:hypothetical protein